MIGRLCEIKAKCGKGPMGLPWPDVEWLITEVELLRQRIVFEQACRVADAQHDYSLAAYMLRDLPITKRAELDGLCNAMHQETASRGDWDCLRRFWDEAYRKEQPHD